MFSGVFRKFRPNCRQSDEIPRAEIKRLLVLASEEASRAEFEVTAGYVVVSASENRDSYCAVCYCPTTNRCARCKAVRYCSRPLSR